MCDSVLECLKVGRILWSWELNKEKGQLWCAALSVHGGGLFEQWLSVFAPYPNLRHKLTASYFYDSFVVVFIHKA